MIPWPFNAPGRCPYLNSPDPKLKKEHEGHKTHLDCYHQTWIEPPLPWFKGGPPRFRCFHLAIGTRDGQYLRPPYGGPICRFA